MYVSSIVIYHMSEYRCMVSPAHAYILNHAHVSHTHTILSTHTIGTHTNRISIQNKYTESKNKI